MPFESRRNRIPLSWRIDRLADSTAWTGQYQITAIIDTNTTTDTATTRETCHGEGGTPARTPHGYIVAGRIMACRIVARRIVAYGEQWRLGRKQQGQIL